MYIIDALKDANEKNAGITNPELKRAGMFLYSEYGDTSLEARRISDGFKGVDGRLVPDWRPTPEELCSDDWELVCEGELAEPMQLKDKNDRGCVPVEHLLQMQKEKAKLVNTLLKLIEDTINKANHDGYDYEDPMICKLPDIAQIIANLTW